MLEMPNQTALPQTQSGETMQINALSGEIPTTTEQKKPINDFEDIMNRFQNWTPEDIKKYGVHWQLKLAEDIMEQQKEANQPKEEETPEKTDEEKAYDKAEEDLKRIWEREDEIRKHTEEREDTAYQRAVEDMRKAGINPNLYGVSAAASGGGITNASRKDYTEQELQQAKWAKEYEEAMENLRQEIEHQFQGKENQKDRIYGMIEKLIGAATGMAGAAIIKK